MFASRYVGIIKDASAKEALLEVFDNKEEDLNLRISASSALLSYMSDAKVYKTLENTIKSENQLLKFGLVNSLRGYKRTKEGKKLLEISNKDKDDGISKTVSGKILLQDTILIEKKGLLSQEDKDFLSALLKKGSINNLSREDIQKLAAIVDKTVAKLKEGTRSGETNMSGSDAAIHDLQLACGESGLTADQLQTQNAQKVEGGRSFARILDAVDEVEKQYSIIKEKLPAVQKELESLDTQIKQRMAELKSQGKTNDDLQKDPQLQDLMAKYSGAMVDLEDLQGKASDLMNAKIKGLEKLKSIKIIDSEMKARVAGANTMTAQLAGGCEQLNGLKAELNAIESKYPDNLDAQKTGIGKLKTKAQGVCDQMVKGMEDLIKQYEASPTANKKTIELLKKELETLKTLKMDDPKAAIAKLEQSRTAIVQTLKSLVPSHLDPREFKALTDLDKGVTTFSSTKMALSSSISSRGAELDARIQFALEEAKKQKTLDTNQGMEMIDKFRPTAEFGIAYGSHFGVSLEAAAGIGGSIGVAEAKIAIGLEAALKVEKSFGAGPAYLLHVDLAAKLRGDISISKLFEAHAELKAGLTAGLAFNNLDEVKEFTKQLGKVALIASSLSEITDMETAEKLQAELEKALDGLGKMVNQHKYTGGFVAVDAGVKSELPSVTAGLSGGWSRQVNTYADGRTIQDDVFKGKVTVGEFGISVSHERSTVVEPKKTEPITRTAVHFSVPVALLREAKEAGSFSKLPKEVLSQIVDQFKALSPGLGTQFEAGVVLSHLNRLLASETGRQKLDRIMAMGSGGHSETEVFIGIEYIDEGAHGQEWAVEMGLEGSKEFKKDIPVGTSGAFVRGGVKVDYEIGLSVVVATTKKEEKHGEGSGAGEHNANSPQPAETHH